MVSLLGHTNVLYPYLRVFDHAPEGKEVSKRLLVVRQGKRSMVEYALDFHTLAAESRWSEAVLKAVFHQGLNQEVHKAITCWDNKDSVIALDI